MRVIDDSFNVSKAIMRLCPPELGFDDMMEISIRILAQSAIGCAICFSST